jgi:hypothetical protein
MLIVIDDRCADAAVPPPVAGAAGAAGVEVFPCAAGSVDDPELPHAAKARLKTAPAARSLRFMAHPL